MKSSTVRKFAAAVAAVVVLAASASAQRRVFTNDDVATAPPPAVAPAAAAVPAQAAPAPAVMSTPQSDLNRVKAIQTALLELYDVIAIKAADEADPVRKKRWEEMNTSLSTVLRTNQINIEELQAKLPPAAQPTAAAPAEAAPAPGSSAPQSAISHGGDYHLAGQAREPRRGWTQSPVFFLTRASLLVIVIPSRAVRRAVAERFLRR